MHHYFDCGLILVPKDRTLQLWTEGRGVLLATFHGDGPVFQETAERLVALWNACQGMERPERLSAAIEALDQLTAALIQMIDWAGMGRHLDGAALELKRDCARQAMAVLPDVRLPITRP